MRVLVTPTFERIAKKLHKQQKVLRDEVVRDIATNPVIGEEKIGDLAGIRVSNFFIRPLDPAGLSYSRSRYRQVTGFRVA